MYEYFVSIGNIEYACGPDFSELEKVVRHIRRYFDVMKREMPEVTMTKERIS